MNTEAEKKPDIPMILFFGALLILGLFIGRQISNLIVMRNEPVEPDMIVLPEEGSYNSKTDN